ncbi:hypothetical protein TWF694_011494 [Orbilia ellipsospora]|uniref:Uncharacterized protein n=1 Tax=Orbilia ellipsospora TaxID=2528407 RepID=A0AAV9X5D6_9PEZI
MGLYYDRPRKKRSVASRESDLAILLQEGIISSIDREQLKLELQLLVDNHATMLTCKSEATLPNGYLKQARSERACSTS